MANKISRRTILLRGMQIPVGGVIAFGFGACGNDSNDGRRDTESGGRAVCADLNEMSDAERSSRRSLNYTETSPYTDEACADCAFFHAGQGGACGTCDMFNGGPVNPEGRCDSWSASVFRRK